MNKYTLVIVDLQKDFYSPDGALYVPGAEKLPAKILEFVKKHKDEIYQVIFTLDWHTIDNESFKMSGGPWPVHCLQYTEGASLPSFLVKAIYDLGIHVEYYKKGAGFADEYGAFSKNSTLIIHRNPTDITKFVLSSDLLPEYEKIYTYSDNYAVCGLCGDYCVMETIKNLRLNPKFKVSAIPDLIMSIDNGKSFSKYIEDTNLETV